MRALELRIPPLVLVFAAALVMWLMGGWAPDWRFEVREQILVAVAIASLGVIFCVGGVLQFRRAQTTTNPMRPVASTSLVTSGVYRLTRNPMYVGFALMLCGWAVFLGNPLSLLVLAGFIYYLNRFQVIPEEQALARIFGPEFDAYCHKTRRWM